MKIKIKSIENGPNIIFKEEKSIGVFCRCGSSQNKPYCDSTHGKIGFKAEGKELEFD